METKFHECAEIYPTGQTGMHISHTGWTCPRESLIHRTCPITLCPVLDQTSLVNNMTIGIWAPPDKSGLHQTCPGTNPNLPIQRVSFRECPEPVWGHPTGLTGMVGRYALIAPMASFLDSYKRHSPTSLWDPSLRWKILELGEEFCVWALEFKSWALWATSSTCEAFVTLGAEAF
jgi:hypothetical protein